MAVSVTQPHLEAMMNAQDPGTNGSIASIVQLTIVGEVAAALPSHLAKSRLSSPGLHIINITAL